jgi:hypothetical protein
MASHISPGPVSRRSTIAALTVGGLGLAVAGGQVAASRQDADAMASHPIVGVWMVTTPIGPSLAVFSADGINIQGVTTTQPGPNGVEFVSAQAGLWEPDGDRRVHFTGVQFHTDAEGNYLGSVTIDGHPKVSDDGQTIIDDAPETTVTIRDAANTIVNVVNGPPSPPATGIRMGVGAPGFPEATPEAGTPAT